MEFCNRAARVLSQANVHFSIVVPIYTLEHTHFEGLKPMRALDGNDIMTTLLSLALYTFIFLVWLLWHLK